MRKLFTIETVVDGETTTATDYTFRELQMVFSMLPLLVLAADDPVTVRISGSLDRVAA